jgi:hypothetical protein
MENLFYNLSEEEFTKGRKILLWIFVAAFFLGGIYVLLASPVLGLHQIKPSLSIAPFGICLIVGLVAAFATIKREDLFFLVDDSKIEFRYGIFKPKKYSFLWSNIKEMVFPHKERKVRLFLNDGSSFIIDLTWLQKKKSAHIRKHIYHSACDKNIKIVKVIHLPRHHK